jgi:hypothetical protein
MQYSFTRLRIYDDLFNVHFQDALLRGSRMALELATPKKSIAASGNSGTPLSDATQKANRSSKKQDDLSSKHYWDRTSGDVYTYIHMYIYAYTRMYMFIYVYMHACNQG